MSTEYNVHNVAHFKNMSIFCVKKAYLWIALYLITDNIFENNFLS